VSRTRKTEPDALLNVDEFLPELCFLASPACAIVKPSGSHSSLWHEQGTQDREIISATRGESGYGQVLSWRRRRIVEELVRQVSRRVGIA